MIASNKYSLPVPLRALERIDRTSSPAHFGKLRDAIDLVVRKNTPVLAAADGIVTFVKDDSDIGGPDPSYWAYSNFVAIRQGTTTWTMVVKGTGWRLCIEVKFWAKWDCQVGAASALSGVYNYRTECLD